MLQVPFLPVDPVPADNMILDHKTIELFGTPLFTWITMKTPMQNPVPLPSEACFAYIMDGDQQYLVEEEDIKADPGNVILSLCGNKLGQMLPGHREGEGRVSSIVVHFQRELLLKVYEHAKPPYWKELDKPVVKYIVQSAASELVKQYFLGLVHLFNHREAVSEDILVLKLKEIILLLLQTKDSELITQVMRSLFSERTFTFKEIVEAHICEPLPLQYLAYLTHHSLTSFKKEFKRIYNTTPGVYILEKRTEKVADLLKYSDENISSIGYQCGFTSPAHLSRVFKNKYGVTPSEYRSAVTA